MRANIIAVFFAAVLVLSINAETAQVNSCHASNIQQGEAALIIDKLNNLRNAAANGTLLKSVTASNMKEIHWDPTLAQSAYKFASRCEKQNSVQNTRNGLYGENSKAAIKEISFVATSKCESFKKPVIEKAFEIWEQGKSHLDHVNVNGYTAEHNEERILSQIIWAETGHVGCAYANYEVLTGEKEYKQYLVCQFQVAGNQKGKPVLLVGGTCKQCSSGHSCTSTKYPALCVNQTDKDTHLSDKNFNFNGGTTPPPPPAKDGCTPMDFDAAQKAIWVQALNDERERIASGKATPLPPSGNMKQLAWDSSLEESAKKWATQCIHAMDVRTSKHINASEIVFGISANASFTTLNDKTALAAWFKGHEHMNATLVNNFQLTTKEANIYAQIAWAKSSRIGCAYSNLVEELGTGIVKRKQYVQIIVCHFTEQGDQPGQKTYETGSKCNHCEGGNKCSEKYPNLCAM